MVQTGHNRRRKVSLKRELELVAIHMEQGPAASAEACRAEGLHPRYAATSASVLGLRRPEKRGRPSCRDTDPRWARAIANGPINV
ncbi:hypothetical protein HAP48_0043040 [Bradyrhizobium septentrionale]|uniref:Uncharacterized protein n=1 Tax=Bradyrhizobium septentrionale TaxID=1404411 RepID=A0A974A2T7_9BRAD|nr:hypothetical protein [Bradyrhizobium septentrionale]UGY15235.1 hypothetical protein HAP48_0043040 [Bradyrhizobium septentrionale]UGY23818.1 hypothetical protein HU675_0038705 [Bradyrhizobium septentrionale]